MKSPSALFDHPGGVQLRMNYDNRRIATADFAGPHENKPTVALLQLFTFYGFSFRFCTIYRRYEKGHAERCVEYVRRKASALKDQLDAIPGAQNYLDNTCIGRNDQKQSRVGKYATFVPGTNHYPVPDYLVGQKVDVKVFANQLKIYHQGEVLGTQPRSYGTGHWVITLDHYLRTLERKPGALQGSAALKQVPWEVRDIYDAAFRANVRDFVELLQYGKTHEISHERLWEVYRQLLVICPGDISVDKLKVLLGNDSQGVGVTYPDSDITRYAKEQLVEIGQILQKN